MGPSPRHNFYRSTLLLPDRPRALIRSFAAMDTQNPGHRLCQVHPQSHASQFPGLSDVCTQACQFQTGDGSMWTEIRYRTRQTMVYKGARPGGQNGNPGQQHTEETK
jgi:hypothetical protein